MISIVIKCSRNLEIIDLSWRLNIVIDGFVTPSSWVTVGADRVVTPFSWVTVGAEDVEYELGTGEGELMILWA